MHSISRMISILIILFCLSISPSAGDSVQYKARSLGVGVQALAINNSGEIVGVMRSSSDGVSHAFFWSQATGFIDLGKGGATDINSEGRVVGCSNENDTEQAFSWKLGESKRYLGNGVAYAINDYGMIAGLAYLDANTPVVWKPSGEMLIVKQVQEGYCYDINASGTAVGYIGPGYQPFTWTETGGIDLLPVRPANSARAYCINDNGLIAGVNDATEACVWMPGCNRLQSLAFQGYYSIAADINDSGQVVGVFSDARGDQACLWDTDGTLVNLDLLVSLQSKACGINDKGVVVGYQYGAVNGPEAIVWEPVPEPASILELSAGLLGCLMWIKRKGA